MKVREIRDDLQKQLDDVNNRIQNAKDTVAALQAEKAAIKSDFDDLQAYLVSKGTP